MRNGRAAAALLLLLSACARQHPAPAAPERFLPADAPLAVVVPSLRAAQEQAAAALRTVLTFPAAADLGETIEAVRQQLGFDPLDPRGLESTGLDLSRGAGFAAAQGAPPLLVLPVRDAARLDEVVTRLARDRLGAARRDTIESGGHTVTVYRTGEGQAPALAMTVVEGSALLATGPDGPARITAAAARPAAEALAGAPSFQRGRAAVGSSPSLLVYFPPRSPAWARLPLLRDGAAVGIAGSGTSLHARAALLLDPERHAWWSGKVDPGPWRDPEAVRRLPGDAFLVGRFDGDVATALRRSLPLDRAAPILQKAGLDLERDLLAGFAPGAAASLSVAPTFRVAAVSGASDLVASDPFQLVHLSAVLHVQDATRMASLFDRLGTLGPKLGIKLARTAPGRSRWRLARGSAVIELALEGSRLLVGGGAGRLDALLSPDAPRYAAPTDAGRGALEGGVGGGVLDFGRLVSTFRALPPAAYGTGPDAFVMRSLADRIIDPASRLVAAAVRLELGPDAAVADVTLDARPVETKAAGAAP
jgi:hypothetical protein